MRVLKNCRKKNKLRSDTLYITILCISLMRLSLKTVEMIEFYDIIEIENHKKERIINDVDIVGKTQAENHYNFTVAADNGICGILCVYGVHRV